MTQRISHTGTINYVVTGASFRSEASNASPTSCNLTSSVAGPSTGFRVASQAISAARPTDQTVPAGATVTKAYLYWTASAGEAGYNGGNPIVDNTVRFYVNGGTVPATDNVTASSTWSGSVSPSTGSTLTRTQYGMGAFADVTSIVAANPNARFRMDNLTVFNGGASTASQTCSTSTVYGNWGLYIIYSLASESTKTLALYDGLQYIGGTTGYASANNVAVTLSGLRVPSAAAGTEKIAKTTILVSDGDASTGASDDSLSLATNLDATFGVSNSLNSTNDVFNGSVTLGPTDGGTATGTTATASPGVVGGLDFDTFDLSARVTGGAQSLTATVDSAGGELLMLYSMVLMATNTTADLAISKTAPAIQSGAGNITYNLTATNAGPNEAYNVLVSDPLPAGVTYVSNTGGGTYNSATRTVTWNLGKVASGASQALSVTVSVPATSATYTNTASISSGSYDPNSANNSASASTSVSGPPTVSKAYSPTSIASNGTSSSTLTITLGNANPSAMTLTSALTDNIGAGLTITALSDTCPGTATFSGTTITYPSGATIPSGGCAITATVTSTTPGNYPNTIPAGALQTNFGSNASATTSTLTVQPQADLQVTKTNNGGTADELSDTLTAGSDAVYRVRVTNNGPSAVTGALLSDAAAANLTVSLVECCDAAGNACTPPPTISALQGSPGVTLPTLANGAFYEIEVTGRVANTVGGTVNNVATVTAPSGTNDPNSANNTANDSDTIVSTPPATALVCDINQGEVAQSFTLTAGSWTSGSTSNAASPFVINAGGQSTQMTINLVNNLSWTAVGGVQSPDLYFTGNTANSLMTAHDATAANQLMSTFNLAFSRPISKLQFSIKDPDFSAGSWQDRLVGRIADTGQQTFDYTGTANCASDNATCNYPASSGATPVLTGYTVEFFSGPNIGNPVNQFIAYNDFSWCALVPVLNIAKTHTGNFNSQSTGVYTLTVTNNGKVPTSGNITVQDLLPAGLTFQGVTTSAGTVTGGTVGQSGTQTFTVSGATIAAGGSLTLTVTVNTPYTTSAQNVTNYASVGGGGDPDPIPTPGAGCTSGQCAADPTTINAAPQADLAITKAGPLNLQPGATVTYTIRVWNNGNFADPSAAITDTVPGVLTGVTWTCVRTGSASCGAANGSGNTISLTANLPLDTGAATTADTNYVTITVTGTAPSAATLESTPSAKTFTNTANVAVSGGLFDPNAANNSASATTNMVYAKLTKSVRNVTQGTAATTSVTGKPGEVLEYCIAYSNFGNAALPNFVITDHVPGNSSALTTGYDAVEPSAATGFGVRLVRGAVTAYSTSAADADAGALSSTGGTFGSGTMTANLGTLAVAESGSVCFQVTIR